ncbi:hypothetical protein [Neisseria dumasiana]|uniref:hypothetical protein n=1 Tax=Neisseria dumasiana TaxID=1931275 RepID=UPI000A1980DB|nr:hypothetical protein [Neisseria dumasiana]OSI15476.1 hypothetical protein BV914_06965 [Neisseria dumasiana]
MNTRRKMTTWEITIISIILCIPMFYVLQQPIVFKYPVGPTLFKIGILSFILILLSGNAGLLHNTPLTDEGGERIRGILKAQALWRRVFTFGGGLLLCFCVFAYPVLKTAVWIGFRFTEERVIQAQIIDIRYNRKTCDKWTLRLPDRADTKVCKTGPSLNWTIGRYIDVGLRESFLAYEVYYLDH